MLVKLDEEYIPSRLDSFYDYLADKDYQSRQREHPRFQSVVEIAKGAAYIYGLETCLEIGCAEGLMTELLAESFGYIYAVDISEKLIANAKKRRIENARFGVYNVEDSLLLFRKNFDMVIISEVLEHLNNPQKIVKQCLQISKYVVASCPMNEQPNPDAFDVSLYGVEKKWADATGHIWSMDEDGFKSLFDGYAIEYFEIADPCGIALVRGAL